MYQIKSSTPISNQVILRSTMSNDLQQTLQKITEKKNCDGPEGRSLYCLNLNCRAPPGRLLQPDLTGWWRDV